ncbi:tRNA (adenosine(37)-N6)-threonylcarbamoyltransferase complex dimerization subunit type 1 TsaB [Demequina sp. B12]|uniref:tRNA (adenosine(37)-N6)-threonylcarbamoyltransferase complex dimerization subunit type 1 TsaB n=1 Tax=Demequina sp. B12 TaxID=2992757 RepID=UPI00237B7611|nr:tRNA (adenosine(37)-N6)-threonylcarbamoyltransferase complex dimerization subunit type 1 TsaB [Demequina sp. B12]MDE0572475.1 tRNA (adenosine(37)-N6)-threonylcarbamoyltransferase complex dimerization subunit type 1 TsaB [Demequina sp. B12]
MILAIDTSAAVSAALVRDDAVLAERAEFAPRGHAELLSGFIEGLLADADATGADIEAIVVGTGPAPFTGLRVGLVTARTMGFAWNVPVYGVCSLDALAAAHGGDVTVVTDARRKEVYWATYRDGERLDGPQVCAATDVQPHGTVIGRGALLYPEAFPGAEGGDPDPAWLARVYRTQASAGITDFPLEPLYLRRPDVHGVPGA